MLRERRAFSNYPENNAKMGQYQFENSQRKSKYQQAHFGDEITIRFVGDMDENIDDIVSNIKCAESAKEEFKSILRIYANKIVKLREERNFYKELLFLREETEVEQNLKLKQNNKFLREQLEDKRYLKDNCERCTCFDDSDFQTSKFTEDQEGFNRLSRATIQSFRSNHSKSQSIQAIKNEKSSEEEMLIESCKNSKCKNQDSLQISETIKESMDHAQSQQLNASISEEELMRLMMKYNISTDELEQIFEEYDRENRQAYELFDSQRQRQLYRLGQRMQKDLWNRKIIKDIKKISS